jgi:hypothetical protein
MASSSGSGVGVVWAAALLLTGCGASLSQVPANKPHGVVVLRFEDKPSDYQYLHFLSINGAPAIEVDDDQETRLKPGTYALTLIAVAYSYELADGKVPLSSCQVGPCSPDLPAPSNPGLGQVVSGHCSQQIEVGLDDGTRVDVRLRVFPDLTCMVQTETP